MKTSKAAVLTPNAMTILEKRYLDGGTVDQMWDRVSGGNETYRNLMSELRFLPNSPTLFNAGKNNGCTLSACFVFSIDDCMAYESNGEFNWNSIMGTKVKAACVAKAGGGVGYYGGDLRTKGSLIKSVHRKACGSVAVIREYQGTSSLITQGGKRELAQMWVTPCWHGDVKDVIHCKDNDPQALGSFNISIAWHDDWMSRVTHDPKARSLSTDKETSLWWEQCEAAWKHGCPGMFFPDVVNKFNINPHLGLMKAPNPCVSYDTQILTSEGRKSIGSCINRSVSIWNGYEWSVVEPKITGFNQPMLRVSFNNGRFLECTEYHRFTLQDGSVVEAHQLEDGQVLQKYRLPSELDDTESYHQPRVVKVERIGNADAVYCFNEPKCGMGVFNDILTPQCGETPNRNDEPCDLGSIVLPRYFEYGNRSINWKLMEEDIWNSIYFLDYILDINEFPHPHITAAAELTRRLGLGVMGWADLLGMMHIHYDTKEAVELGKKIARFKQEVEHAASEQLAKEKGPYPGYDAVKTQAPMRRNETTGSIAPTGSISIIAGCWGSIEPHFALGNHGGDDVERTTAEGIKLQDGVQDEWWGQFDGFVPKTASQITPEWHIKHQAAWQEFTDLGCSKCVVGDTLVLTGTGWREIQSLHSERGDDVFRSMRLPVHGESEMTCTGEFYSGGIRDTIRVKTQQGSELEGTPNHRVRVERGGQIVWCRMDQLIENDLVVIRLDQQVYSDEELVSPELACLLGHAVADGCIQNNWLVMFHTDPSVTTERESLLSISEVRQRVESGRNTRGTDRTPSIKVDKRTGVVGVQQNSRNMVKWLEEELGLKRRAANKSVPLAVLQSNWAVQRAFFRGLFTDCGVANRPTPNLMFNTASSKLAIQVRAMLMNAGMYTSHKTHVVNGKEYYRLHFVYTDAMKFAEMVGFVEPSRRKQFKNWIGHISTGTNPHGQMPTPREGYRVERVKKLVTGRAPVFDISVPDNYHAFITAGMISHNTINLPKSATVEDVSNCYKMLYDTGCKGGTIFRDGCRDEQVLVKKKTSSVYQTNLPADLPKSLPDTVNHALLDTMSRMPDATAKPTRKIKVVADEIDAKRVKIHINEFKAYLHVGLDEQTKQPVEIFIRASKNGSTINGFLDAWAINFSMSLQAGVSLATICNMHKGQRFEPAGLTGNKDVPICSSVVDFVAQWLYKRYVVRDALLTGKSIPSGSESSVSSVKDNGEHKPIRSGQLCPDCGNELIHQAGCMLCPGEGCGWSRCG